jgi:hypothetical protein
MLEVGKEYDIDFGHCVGRVKVLGYLEDQGTYLLLGVEQPYLKVSLEELTCQE